MIYRGYYMPSVDTNFIFERSTREQVRYRVEHEKIKFVSKSAHVLFWTFCLLYKQYLGDFSNFPKISEHFPKISDNFRRLLKILWRLSEIYTNISNHFPKISEDVRRLPTLPNISGQSSKMFRSSWYKFRIVGKLDSTYDVIDIFACADMMFSQ